MHRFITLILIAVFGPNPTTTVHLPNTVPKGLMGRLKPRTAATKSAKVSPKLLNAIGSGRTTVATDFSNSLKLFFALGAETASGSVHSKLVGS